MIPRYYNKQRLKRKERGKMSNNICWLVYTLKNGSLAAASKRTRTSGAEVYCSRHVPSNFTRSIGSPMLHPSKPTCHFKQILLPSNHSLPPHSIKWASKMRYREKEMGKQTRASSMIERWSAFVFWPRCVPWIVLNRSCFLFSNSNSDTWNPNALSQLAQKMDDR